MAVSHSDSWLDPANVAVPNTLYVDDRSANEVRHLGDLVANGARSVEGLRVGGLVEANRQRRRLRVMRRIHKASRRARGL